MTYNELISMLLMSTFYFEYQKQLKETPQGFRVIGKVLFYNAEDKSATNKCWISSIDDLPSKTSWRF